MRIKRITLHPVTTPRETGSLSQHVIVRIETDSDVVGIGEMSDMSHAPFTQPDLGDLEIVANQFLVGREPIALTENYRVLCQMLPGGGKATVERAGFDQALWDAVAKQLHQPVYNLLGGKVRDRIRVCYPIFRMRSMDEVAGNLARVERRYAEGFDLFRLYCGGNVEADEAFLGGLRDRHGPKVQIKSLDLSGTLDWKAALNVLDRLIPLADPILVESVCHRADLEGMAEIRRRIDRPVSEHINGLQDAFAMARARAVDIFNISLVSCGGISEARQVYAVAQAAGLGTLVGTTQELSIGTAGQLHLAAAMPNYTHPGDCTGPVLYLEDVARERVRYENSHAIVPDGEGFGILLDEGKLDELKAPLTMAKR